MLLLHNGRSAVVPCLIRQHSSRNPTFEAAAGLYSKGTGDRRIFRGQSGLIGALLSVYGDGRAGAESIPGRICGRCLWSTLRRRTAGRGECCHGSLPVRLRFAADSHAPSTATVAAGVHRARLWQSVACGQANSQTPLNQCACPLCEPDNQALVRYYDLKWHRRE
jgi:hypothetical protein